MSLSITVAQNSDEEDSLAIQPPWKQSLYRQLEQPALPPLSYATLLIGEKALAIICASPEQATVTLASGTYVLLNQPVLYTQVCSSEGPQSDDLLPMG